MVEKFCSDDAEGDAGGCATAVKTALAPLDLAGLTGSDECWRNIWQMSSLAAAAEKEETEDVDCSIEEGGRRLLDCHRRLEAD